MSHRLARAMLDQAPRCEERDGRLTPAGKFWIAYLVVVAAVCFVAYLCGYAVAIIESLH